MEGCQTMVRYRRTMDLTDNGERGSGFGETWSEIQILRVRQPAPAT